MQAERLKQRVLPALLHPVLDLKAKRLPQRVLPPLLHPLLHLKAERLRQRVVWQGPRRVYTWWWVSVWRATWVCCVS